MEGEGFLLQLVDLRGLGLDNLQFAGQIADLKLKKSNILKSLLILHFSLRESRLQNLDLFIEQGKLIISSNELCSENISLVLLGAIEFLKLIVVFRDVCDDLGVHFLLHLLGGELAVEAGDSRLKVLFVLCQTLLLALDHAKSVVLIG